MKTAFNLVEAKSTLKDLVRIVSTQFEELLPVIEYVLEYKNIPMPEITEL